MTGSRMKKTYVDRVGLYVFVTTVIKLYTTHRLHGSHVKIVENMVILIIIYRGGSGTVRVEL